MKEKILILVKTYPTFSKTYFELVCTAGVNEQGKWRRIYPIPFRELKEHERYKKYQWVEVDIKKNPSDPRPESYKLERPPSIRIVNAPLPMTNNWLLRKEALDQTPVYTGLDEVIKKANDENSLSLCQFKPREILELKVERVDSNWKPEILDEIEAQNKQGFLFKDMKRKIELVKKVPYKFSYRFKDDQGRESTLMIEDWEIGVLYRKCLKRADGNEGEALQKVKEKYGGFIENSDITLFLGTTRQFHGRAANPFVIIGVFYPPKTKQSELF